MPRVNRRTALKLSGSVAVAGMGGLAGCIGDSDDELVSPLDVETIPPEETEDQLNHWGYNNLWYEPVQEEFEESYDVDLNLAYVVHTAEQIAEFEQGNEEIDSIGTTPYVINQGLREESDWWEPLPVDRMDSWDNLNDQAREISEEHFTRDGEVYAMACQQMVSPTIIYNEDYFGDPPDSWSILWEEDLDDRMAMLDNGIWNCYAAAFHTGQDPFEPDDLDEIEEVLEQQQELNRTYFGDFSQGQSLMSREETYVVANPYGRAYNSYFDDDATFVDWTIPQEGAILDDLPRAIPVNTSAPRAALAWIEYVLTGDRPVQLFEGHGIVPMIQDWHDVASEAGIPDERIEYMSIDEKNPHDAPLYPTSAFDPEVREEYLDIWTRIRG